MAKKSEGLKVHEMEMVLKKLAFFHSASAVHFERNGSYDEKFSRGVYNIGMKKIFDQSFDFNFGFVINEFVSKWPNLDKKIVDKMVSYNKSSSARSESMTFYFEEKMA